MKVSLRLTVDVDPAELEMNYGEDYTPKQVRNHVKGDLINNAVHQTRMSYDVEIIDHNCGDVPGIDFLS